MENFTPSMLALRNGSTPDPQIAGADLWHLFWGAELLVLTGVKGVEKADFAPGVSRT